MVYKKHLENKNPDAFSYTPKLCSNLPMYVQSGEEEMGWEQNILF